MRPAIVSSSLAAGPSSAAASGAHFISGRLRPQPRGQVLPVSKCSIRPSAGALWSLRTFALRSRNSRIDVFYTPYAPAREPGGFFRSCAAAGPAARLDAVLEDGELVDRRLRQHVRTHGERLPELHLRVGSSGIRTVCTPGQGSRSLGVLATPWDALRGEKDNFRRTDASRIHFWAL